MSWYVVLASGFALAVCALGALLINRRLRRRTTQYEYGGTSHQGAWTGDDLDKLRGEVSAGTESVSRKLEALAKNLVAVLRQTDERLSELTDQVQAARSEQTDLSEIARSLEERLDGSAQKIASLSDLAEEIARECRIITNSAVPTVKLELLEMTRSYADSLSVRLTHVESHLGTLSKSFSSNADDVSILTTKVTELLSLLGRSEDPPAPKETPDAGGNAEGGSPGVSYSDEEVVIGIPDLKRQDPLLTRPPKRTADAQPDPAPDSLRIPATAYMFLRTSSGAWQAFIRVDCEPDVCPTVQILQGDAREEIQRADEYVFGPIRDLSRAIYLSAGNGRALRQIFSPGKPPILFRVVADGLAESASGLSRPDTLAVVPSDWNYDLARSHAPPQEPEALGVPGFRVHYLPGHSGAVAVFTRPDVDPLELRATRPQFWLEGQVQPNLTDRTGPLFLGELPTLVSNNSLSVVYSIVVGEEERNKGKWRERFDVSTTSDRWKLAENMPTLPQGWYFIRLYDVDERLLDGLHFRYLPGVRKIEVSTNAGANLDFTTVTFTYEPNVSIALLGPVESRAEISSSRDPHVTALKWQSDPEIVEVEFDIEDRDRVVRIALDVDGFCWTLDRGGATSRKHSYQVTPLSLRPQDFLPDSEVELWVRVPDRFVGNLVLGFASERSQEFLRDQDKILVKVPLAAFAGSIELASRGGHPLMLYPSEASLLVPLRVATAEVDPSCSFCGREFTTSEGLADHLLLEHHDECLATMGLI